MYLSCIAHRTGLTKSAWTETEGTYRLTKSWFDTRTSIYRTTAKLITKNGEIIVPREEQGYHANEMTRCYTPPEMERLLTDAGFSETIHLSEKHFEDPTVSLEPGDIVEIAVARKAWSWDQTVCFRKMAEPNISLQLTARHVLERDD